MEITSKYTIYNKDSRHLLEIKHKSIDLVITSPPYNICHKYMSYHDSLDYKDFEDLYMTVIESISRVLKEDGFFIIDIADMIVMESTIIYGAEFIKEKAYSSHLEFICSYPYIAIEDSGEKIKNCCITRNDVTQKFHSLCEQILVFGKSSTPRDLTNNMRIKSSYSFSSLYDSAFWPDDLVNDILAPFSLKGKLLLDPFMGSGTIGRKVIEQGGSFIGYDVDSKTLNTFKWI